MWNWRKRQEMATASRVQLRNGEHHPFGMLGEYVPLARGEARLYRAVREAVPVVDAAIYKLIRMTGGASVQCGDPAAEKALVEFLRSVPAGRGQFGWNAFLDCYLDSMLTCGRGVGELVLDCQGREIAALLCAGPEQVEIRVKYEGYIQRQLQEVADFQKMEDHALPPALDYSAIQGLRLEAREKLQAVRPLNLGQASRISGWIGSPYSEAGGGLPIFSFPPPGGSVGRCSPGTSPRSLPVG